MVQLAIRCHPRVPVSVGELEGWLERQLADLRADVPRAMVRLSRLTQSGPNADIDIGWLVELELPDGEPPLGEQRLADSLRDMRLLGLQPTLFTPRSARSDLLDAARRFRSAAAQPWGHAAAPDALTALEEALQALSAGWYQLAADAAPEDQLVSKLHDVAAAFARCARVCREGRSTAARSVARASA